MFTVTRSSEGKDDLLQKLHAKQVEYAPVAVAIRGGNFSKEQKEVIKTYIQELVSMARLNLRLGQPVTGVSEATQNAVSNSMVVCLSGLSLPQDSKRWVEHKIRGKTSEFLIQESVSADTTCICAGDIPGMGPLDPEPCGTPPKYSDIGVDIYNIYGLLISSDSLHVEVESGTTFNLSPKQMVIGLKTEVDWAKEIVGWSLCHGRLSSVMQNGKNSNANYMILNDECGGADSIIFRKPRMFGIWADEFHLDPSQFWNCWRGNIVTFTWFIDTP